MNDFENLIDKFIPKLQKDKYTKNKCIFNPWADFDENYDTKNAVEIRCNNLKQYFT